MPLFLGLDLGTSYFKAAVIGDSGALRGLGRVAVPRKEPASGRSEVPVPALWSCLREAVAAALKEARATPAELTGLAYSSQATSFLLLDERDAPLTPLIVWNDRRGDPSVAALRGFVDQEEFRRRVGYCDISGQTALAKWHHLRTQEPKLWARTRRIMTLGDYLTFALTGERAGDAGTAAFLGAFDLQRNTWWLAALAEAGVPPEFLSRPLRPGTPCGRTGRRATELLGLPAGLPFAVGSIDHHVAAFGAGLGTFADVSISTGTVLAAVARVTAVEPLPGRYHGPDVAAGRYYRLTFDPAGAGQLEEFQRRFAPDQTLPQLLEQAAAAREGARTTEAGPRVLALLESVARTQAVLVAGASAGSGIAGPLTVVATGGGARSPLWLQIQADTLDCPVTTTATPEPGCLGAAVFAAAASGHFRTLADASFAMVHSGLRYLPRHAA